MKKILFSIIIFCFAFCSCSSQQAVPETVVKQDSYIKSVWIAYYELEEFTKDSSESEFKDKITDAFKLIERLGFNTVTVQVRPCADAFYKSEYFPTSVYFNSKQGSRLDYDPLEIMCDLSQKYKLNLEAWINPYRVSQDNDWSKLSENNKAVIWHNSDDKSDYVKEVSGKLYFNPAYDEVNELIVNGVKEIVENYPISSVHFDDYFYPTDEIEFDEKEYSSYKDKGGKLSLSDWRRNNVNTMIKSVYKAIKKENSEVRFGISPASNIKNDYNNLYADIYEWVNEDGYIDYICPQIYFGFKNVYQPFMFTVKKWLKLVENSNVDLYIGLPLYKCGKIDDYASENDEDIKNEFINNNDIISRQITYISKLDKIKGYYVFSYSQLDSETTKEEVSRISSMQNSSLPLRQPFL